MCETGTVDLCFGRKIGSWFEVSDQHEDRSCGFWVGVWLGVVGAQEHKHKRLTGLTVTALNRLLLGAQQDLPQKIISPVLHRSLKNRRAAVVRCLCDENVCAAVTHNCTFL